jgi:spore germination cell wall hydrolase CwlJ-like protein
MEITEQQFISNYEGMPEDQQALVSEILEEHDSETLRAFATVLGVNLQMSGEQEPQEPMQEPQEPMPELSEEMSEPEQEIPQTDEMSPITREMMALGDEVATTGPIQKEGADDSGVADDVPMDAEQESFVINAAAVDEVGELDLEQRIIQPAVEALQKEGIKITIADLKRPQEQVNGDVPVAVSNGEYYIPRVLARKIGYGLLKKINDRGKPETEKKLEEQKEQQPQEPQAEMQAALGKRIQMNEGDKIPTPKRKPSPSRKQEDMAMAETLIAEAGMFDRQGMQKVMNVIQNRQKSKLNFKEDSKDFFSITSAPGQFSGYIGRAQDKFKPTKKQMNDALDLVRLARENKLEDLTGGAIYFYNPAGAAGKKYAETKEGMEFMEKIKNNPNFVMTTSDGKKDSNYRLEYFAPRKDVSENIALDSDMTQSIPLDRVEVGRDENITRDLLPSFGATASGEVVGP